MIAPIICVMVMNKRVYDVSFSKLIQRVDF